MKKQIISLFAATASLLFAASCTKTLDLDYDEIEPLLVVQGNVSNYGMKVFVGHHSNMRDTVNKDCYTDAEVSIAGDDGFSEKLEYADGYYVSPSNAKGVEGVTYTLHVKRGNKECYAESTMPTTVAIDSFKWDWLPIINDIEIRVLNIYLNDDPDVDNYYFLEMLRDGDIMKNAVASDFGLEPPFNYFNWGISSRNHLEDEEKERQKTGKRKKDILYVGDGISIRLRSIDWNAFHYLTTAEENEKGINPETNLKGENCVGYFSAYGEYRINTTFPSLDE